MDGGGNVDAGATPDAAPKPGRWRRAKWGQILAFGSGGLSLFLAIAGSGYYGDSNQHARIQVGTTLLAVGLALRAIDAIETLTRSLALRGDHPDQPL